jgi:deoxyribodipyrimidine photolyase
MKELKKTKKLVLALGESTHTHIMHCEKEIEYDLDQNTEAIKFVLRERGIITHEEHDRIVLEPGAYVKTNQVEFDPFNQTVSRVFD